MADPPPPKMPAKPKKPTAPWRLKLAKALPWILALYLVGLLVQVFLAGYGLVEVGGEGLGAHIDFAHVIEFIPLLVVVVGFVGADWRAGVVGVVLLVLFQLQYMFIQLDPAAMRALHPTNAVVMVAVAFALLMRRLPWTERPAPQA